MNPLIHLIVRQEMHLNDQLPRRPETPALTRAPRHAPLVIKEKQPCQLSADLHNTPRECP